MTDDARAKLGDLFQSLWTLGALTVAAERGVLDQVAAGRSLDAIADAAGLPPPVVRAALDVLASAGLLDIADDRIALAPSFATMLNGGTDLLRADLRSTLGQLGELVIAARDRSASLQGWRATDPTIIEAQAIVSGGATEQLRQFLSNHPEARERLTRPGAVALDVGAGGAGVCIAFAKAFPQLRVVGLEPAPQALAIGRRRVEEAALSDRIELRGDKMEELTDHAAFDLAWVAQMFLPDPVLATGLPALRRAMRPGGLVITAATCVSGSTPAACVARFRSATWGSPPDRYPEALIAMLERAGFVDVAIPINPPGATALPVIARAPSS